MYKDRFHFADPSPVRIAYAPPPAPKPSRVQSVAYYAAVLALAAGVGWSFESHVIPAAEWVRSAIVAPHAAQAAPQTACALRTAT